MAAPLGFMDNEQRPNVAGLMVCTDKALHVCFVLEDEENGLIHVPCDLRVAYEGGIAATILDRSMSHL